jgi:hypothetical protein
MSNVDPLYYIEAFSRELVTDATSMMPALNVVGMCLPVIPPRLPAIRETAQHIIWSRLPECKGDGSESSKCVGRKGWAPSSHRSQGLVAGQGVDPALLTNTLVHSTMVPFALSSTNDGLV